MCICARQNLPFASFFSMMTTSSFLMLISPSDWPLNSYTALYVDSLGAGGATGGGGGGGARTAEELDSTRDCATNPLLG